MVVRMEWADPAPSFCEIGKSMSKKNIIETVREILAGYLQENGYELWNVEFVKEGKDFHLRVYIDTLDRSGVGTDDCEKVSKYLSEILDRLDPIETGYYLVVSSPGMDRPLLTTEHFKRYRGSPVVVSLYRAIDGRKKISGMLGLRSDVGLELFPEDMGAGAPLLIPLDQISKVRLQVIY